MHSRSDRDKYLTILWSNIQNNMKSEFQRMGSGQNKILGPFDYQSIMLYGARLFSANGRDTMIARGGNSRGVSLKDTADKFGLSKMDIFNINQLYGCNGNVPKGPIGPKVNGPKGRGPKGKPKSRRTG